MNRNSSGKFVAIELDRWENEGGSCYVANRSSSEARRILIRSQQAMVEKADRKAPAKNDAPQLFGTRFAMYRR